MGNEAIDKREGLVLNGTDRLKRVIVLEPGEELMRMTVLAPCAHPSLPEFTMSIGAKGQHQGFVRVLEADDDIEVLRFDDLLNSALCVARKKGELRSSLVEVCKGANTLVQKGERLDANDLLGRGDFFYQQNDQGRFAPLVSPDFLMTFMRDVGTMTPRGFVLGRLYQNRVYETALVRFVFRRAPELAAYPIVFDAESEGVGLQGGDLMVLDEQTLLLGVGNCSESRAAKSLAQKLRLDVLAVSLPSVNLPLSVNLPFRQRAPRLHLSFLHLDSFFSLVDRDKALTIPYLLERSFTNDNPLLDLLKDLESDWVTRQRCHGEHLRTPRDLIRRAMYALLVSPGRAIRNACNVLKSIGWVTRYEAVSGKATLLDGKLVDVMRDRGYTIIHVGGEKGDLCEEQYLLERVLYEFEFQAANVFATRPGKVIAYAENSHTVQALREAGVEVSTCYGSCLTMGHGGPDCLTLAIERVAD